MGLLDRAYNFAKKAYNYVAGNDNETKPAAKKSTVKSAKAQGTQNANGNTPATSKAKPELNSIHNPNNATTGTIGDEVVKSKSQKTTNTQKSKNIVAEQKSYSVDLQANKNQKVVSEIKKVQSNIQKKCQKFGISYAEAKATILDQLEFSKEAFVALAPEEQLSTLLYIDSALNLYINKKIKMDSSINKAAVLGQTAKNIQMAKEEGGVNSLEEFEEGLGELSALDAKIKDVSSDEEVIDLIEESRKSFEKACDVQRQAEISRCNGNEAEIAKINAKYEKRLEAFQMESLNQFNAKHGPKMAHVSTYMVSGKNWGYGVKQMLSLYDSATRTEITKSMPHSFEVEAKRRYFEAGDSISSEQYGLAVQEITQYMEEAVLRQFEADAYEFRKKVENGEIDAPYMSKEDFTAETTAIGVGITANKNMSTQAKAELLNTWDRHASEFEDYFDVKTAYNKAVEKISAENGHFAQGATNLKKIMREQYYNDIEHFPRAWKKRQKDVTTELKQKADESTLKSELKSKTVSEIKRDYANSMSEIAEIILANDVEYRNRIDDVLDYLDGFSGTDIGLKIKGCSTRTISKIVQAFPRKASDILDIVAPSMCYAGKKSVERIVEEGQQNEAA